VLLAPFPLAGTVAVISLDFDYFVRTIMVWFIVTNTVYLVSACAFRRRVSRLGCLVAGAAAGIAWPYGAIALYAISPPFLSHLLGFPTIPHSPGELLAHQLAKPMAITLAGAAIGCLAGCYQGWALWWIGVRPAPEPLPEDLQAVFE
jgi:hypothetical protein